MKEETKHEITAVLNLLKGSLTRNDVSIATDSSGHLIFFDTAAYIKSGGKDFDGFRININDLVK